MKDKISFVRFGNLNPVKHKEHREKLGPGYENEEYHIAPKLKGIWLSRYFPWQTTALIT